MSRILTFEVKMDDKLDQIRNHIVDGTPHAQEIECVNVETVTGEDDDD